MIISKAFTLAENVGSGKTISIPDASSTTTYPIVGKFIVDGINEALTNFNAHINYDEQTGEAEMDGVHFFITASLSYIQVYFHGDDELGYNSISAKFSGNTMSYRMVVTIKGSEDSFEIFLAAGLDVSSTACMFGKYNLRRLSDGKTLTAFRRNNTNGTFWVFDLGVFKEHAAVIKPDKTYAYSDFTYSGYALVPAVLTNFAYQIMNVYLYCPMLESGNHYTIADISVVAVQSSLLLKC